MCMKQIITCAASMGHAARSANATGDASLSAQMTGDACKVDPLDWSLEDYVVSQCVEGIFKLVHAQVVARMCKGLKSCC